MRVNATSGATPLSATRHTKGTMSADNFGTWVPPIEIPPHFEELLNDPDSDIISILEYPQLLSLFNEGEETVVDRLSSSVSSILDVFYETNKKSLISIICELFTSSKNVALLETLTDVCEIDLLIRIFMDNSITTSSSSFLCSCDSKTKSSNKLLEKTKQEGEIEIDNENLSDISNIQIKSEDSPKNISNKNDSLNLQENISLMSCKAKPFHSTDHLINHQNQFQRHQRHFSTNDGSFYSHANQITCDDLFKIGAATQIILAALDKWPANLMCSFYQSNYFFLAILKKVDETAVYLLIDCLVKLADTYSPSFIWGYFLSLMKGKCEESPPSKWDCSPQCISLCAEVEITVEQRLLIYRIIYSFMAQYPNEREFCNIVFRCLPTLLTYANNSEEQAELLNFAINFPSNSLMINTALALAKKLPMCTDITEKAISYLSLHADDVPIGEIIQVFHSLFERAQPNNFVFRVAANLIEETMEKHKDSDFFVLAMQYMIAYSWNHQSSKAKKLNDEKTIGDLTQPNNFRNDQNDNQIEDQNENPMELEDENRKSKKKQNKNDQKKKKQKIKKTKGKNKKRKEKKNRTKGDGENKSEDESKSEDENKSDDENKSEDDNKSEDENRSDDEEMQLKKSREKNDDNDFKSDDDSENSYDSNISQSYSHNSSSRSERKNKENSLNSKGDQSIQCCSNQNNDKNRRELMYKAFLLGYSTIFGDQSMWDEWTAFYQSVVGPFSRRCPVTTEYKFDEENWDQSLIEAINSGKADFNQFYEYFLNEKSKRHSVAAINKANVPDFYKKPQNPSYDARKNPIRPIPIKPTASRTSIKPRPDRLVIKMKPKSSTPQPFSKDGSNKQKDNRMNHYKKQKGCNVC
ncbi:hypothetical protein TRFO_29253 [Tritrichomonas foetus]|uniref:Uncharacterized protein n=1 Tax=Tritrichomonas foetus TaxID=1144522 RepID=A0A1J4JW22_9EUKA|nr:hypothetical protein TRFO_29253 [Tritrichomonas foetus]|eukprot:OHT03337.1 hypothetical protein TRFO_29253 [Tritrichomonas foetus]